LGKPTQSSGRVFRGWQTVNQESVEALHYYCSLVVVGPLKLQLIYTRNPPSIKKQQVIVLLDIGIVFRMYSSKRLLSLHVYVRIHGKPDDHVNQEAMQHSETIPFASALCNTEVTKHSICRWYKPPKPVGHLTIVYYAAVKIRSINVDPYIWDDRGVIQSAVVNDAMLEVYLLRQYNMVNEHANCCVQL